MPSHALRKWRTTQRAELDRLDAAVRAVHASDRALRQQLVDMYILLLAGQFQLFCRSLHDEAPPPPEPAPAAQADRYSFVSTNSR